MTKTKRKIRARAVALEAGQVWRMAGTRLQVGFVGKLLVHYKLSKSDAVRVPNSVSAKTAVEEYLRKNKGILMRKKSGQ